jgi:cephalosporin hydroxylase
MTEVEKEIDQRIDANAKDVELQASAQGFLKSTIASRYSYNFSWLGRPIIQYPQDIVAMQELLSAVQPDLVIETGIAHGGSLIFSASMLELNAACGGPTDAKVLGIDIDIRPQNRSAVEAHPLFKRIEMIQGSSIDPEIVKIVKTRAKDRRVLVCLDSNHTHEHVLAELEAYAPLTSVGSYCVVFDTVIEYLPKDFFGDRPWSPGDNPSTAATEFLKSHPEFTIDERIDNKLLISVAPRGYLKRTR